MPAGTAAITDLHVAVSATGRVVYTIVRSSLSVSFEQSMIGLLQGHVTATKMSQGTKVDRRMVRIGTVPSSTLIPTLPPDVQKLLRPGDTLARFDNVPDEQLSACGIAVPAGMEAGMPVLASPHLPEFEVRCVDVPRDSHVVTIVTPPQKRFD